MHVTLVCKIWSENVGMCSCSPHQSPCLTMVWQFVNFAESIAYQVHSQDFLTLKEPGFLDPSHSRGGGFPPFSKISETDWQNIKCVVLVDSYDPPESIGTQKSANIPFMTPQWHHKWRHVKNTKITENRQNHGFSLFFQAMMCVKVCLHMFLLQINQINKI